jgi:hypothetical protein
MQRNISWLWAVGFLGLFTAADAQTPPPSAAGTPFDGKYRLVSAARVNATYTTRKGQTGPCPDRRAGSLTIVNGQARYTSATGYRVRGTVGPLGELAMRAVAPSSWASQPIDLSVNGTVDGAGTARVRQLSHSCSYDFVWQKGTG